MEFAVTSYKQESCIPRLAKRAKNNKSDTTRVCNDTDSPNLFLFFNLLLVNSFTN